MANDVFETVLNCQSCAKASGTLTTNQQNLRLLPTNGPLEFVAMDNLGSLARIETGKRFILVMTYRYYKLTRVIHMNDKAEPLLDACFVNNWVFPYVIPHYVRRDNVLQFIAQFSYIVCSVLGTKRIPITTNHPQYNRQVDRYNKSITARLRHYIFDHQNDWDLYVQLLTWGYNTKVHKTTSTTPFSLSLTRHLQSSILETIFTTNSPDRFGPLSTRELRMRVLECFGKMFGAADIVQD